MKVSKRQLTTAVLLGLLGMGMSGIGMAQTPGIYAGECASQWDWGNAKNIFTGYKGAVSLHQGKEPLSPWDLKEVAKFFLGCDGEHGVNLAVYQNTDNIRALQDNAAPSGTSSYSDALKKLKEQFESVLEVKKDKEGHVINNGLYDSSDNPVYWGDLEKLGIWNYFLGDGEQSGLIGQVVANRKALQQLSPGSNLSTIDEQKIKTVEDRLRKKSATDRITYGDVNEAMEVLFGTDGESGIIGEADKNQQVIHDLFTKKGWQAPPAQKPGTGRHDYTGTTGVEDLKDNMIQFGADILNPYNEYVQDGHGKESLVWNILDRPIDFFAGTCEGTGMAAAVNHNTEALTKLLKYGSTSDLMLTPLPIGNSAAKQQIMQKLGAWDNPTWKDLDFAFDYLFGPDGKSGLVGKAAKNRQAINQLTNNQFAAIDEQTIYNKYNALRQHKDQKPTYDDLKDFVTYIFGTDGNSGLIGEINRNSTVIKKLAAEQTPGQTPGQTPRHPEITNSPDISRNAAYIARNVDAIIAVNHKVTATAQEVKKVGARSAALAGLHPVDDGTAKFSLAVATGGYKGENAVAMGMFYRPTKDVLVSASSTVGGDTAYTVGVSFKIGSAVVQEKLPISTPTTQEFYKAIETLQRHIVTLEQKVQQLEAARTGQRK